MTTNLFYSQQEIAGNAYIIASTEVGLAFVGTPNRSVDELQSLYPKQSIIEEETALQQEAAEQLSEYFNQKRHIFNLPLDPIGTPFQQDVWQALQQISYGETTTYQGIAESINRPKAYRAVGTAIGRNPLLIIVPCHRIIGKNGKLTGFRAGMDVKQDLLTLEQNRMHK